MNAHSFITHRMFVAALNCEAPELAGSEARGPGRQARQANATAAASNFPARTRPQPANGMLLVNAMLNGYQAAAS